MFSSAAHSLPEVTLAAKMGFDDVITSKLWNLQGKISSQYSSPQPLMMLCTCNSIVFSHEQLLEIREQSTRAHRPSGSLTLGSQAGIMLEYGPPQVNYCCTPSLASHTLRHHSTCIHAKPGASKSSRAGQHSNAGRQPIQQHWLTKLQGICLRILASFCYMRKMLHLAKNV